METNITTRLQSETVHGVANPEDHDRIRRLMFFFGLVYVVEGIGQTGGIIAQPLSYYLKEVYAWTPVQVTAFLTVFNFPWIIKPVYGLISDFLPLFVYPRHNYIIMVYLLSSGFYLFLHSYALP